MKPRHHRAYQRLLLARRLRIKVRIRAAQHVRQKCKKIKLHRQMVFAGGHQIGLHGAQGALVRLPIFVAEFIPAGPPSRPQHVQSRGLNLRQVAVPHVNVRMLEVKPLHVAGHVGGSRNRQRLPIDFEVVAVHGEARPGM